MIEEIKNINASKKALKDFGITFGTILILISGFLFFKNKESYKILAYTASFLILIGYTFPKILKPIYYIWMTFAVILGWIMTRVILSLLFFLIITPIGLVARLFGKDFLELKKQAVEGSYWNLRDGKAEQNINLKKQF